MWLTLFFALASAPAAALMRAPEPAGFERAVLGDRAACHALGEAALDRGDYAEAWAWFALHAEGDRFLQDHLRMMWPFMGPERLARAGALQAEWQRAVEPVYAPIWSPQVAANSVGLRVSTP